MAWSQFMSPPKPVPPIYPEQETFDEQLRSHSNFYQKPDKLKNSWDDDNQQSVYSNDDPDSGSLEYEDMDLIDTSDPEFTKTITKPKNTTALIFAIIASCIIFGLCVLEQYQNKKSNDRSEYAKLYAPIIISVLSLCMLGSAAAAMFTEFDSVYYILGICALGIGVTAFVDKAVAYYNTSVIDMVPHTAAILVLSILVAIDMAIIAFK